MFRKGGQCKVCYRIADQVTWTSQSKGRITAKVGKVVAKVPPYKLPHQVVNCDQYDTRHLRGGMFGRPYWSFLVEVENPTGGKSRLYWPRMFDLSPVT